MFGEAAELEARALAQIPEDKLRTRGILAVSYVALLYKAGELDKAERASYELLAGDKIADAAKTELRDLLETVWDEQALATTGLHYSGNEILIALRGGQIGSGTAPLETALHYINGMTSLVYRVAEWQGQLPFRTRGLPPPEVKELVQARATQPSAGSYRFSIKLVESLQQWLFAEPQRINPKVVSDGIIKAIRSAVLETSEPLSSAIPDPQYRATLVKLVRNVLPNSANLREVEVRTRLEGSDDQSVTLNLGARLRIAEYLRAERVAETSATPIRVEGVLRALHLDNNWLEITESDGKHVRFKTREDEVDDIIGPMVNRRVVAFGTKQKGDPFLLDIELQEATA